MYYWYSLPVTFSQNPNSIPLYHLGTFLKCGWKSYSQRIIHNTYSLLKDLPPFFVEAPNAQWVDILSEVELIFSCVIVICFLIIHSGQVPKLNEYIAKKIKNNQVFDCTVLSVGTDIIYAGSTYLLSKLIR